MKNSIKYFGIALMMAVGFQAQAQDVDVDVVDVDVEEKSIWDRELPNFRAQDRRGIVEFEPTKVTD